MRPGRFRAISGAPEARFRLVAPLRRDHTLALQPVEPSERRLGDRRGRRRSQVVAPGGPDVLFARAVARLVPLRLGGVARRLRLHGARPDLRAVERGHHLAVPDHVALAHVQRVDATGDFRRDGDVDRVRLALNEVAAAARGDQHQPAQMATLHRGVPPFARSK